jgi:hypothetical protein
MRRDGTPGARKSSGHGRGRDQGHHAEQAQQGVGEVNERTLFHRPGIPSPDVREELLNWWELNPRPTEAYFRGEDSRIG